MRTNSLKILNVSRFHPITTQRGQYIIMQISENVWFYLHVAPCDKLPSIWSNNNLLKLFNIALGDFNKQLNQLKWFVIIIKFKSII